MSSPGLAELHLHLYGCLTSDHVLDMLALAERPAWDRYEPSYERVFGRPSPARALVERHRRGDASARAEFRELFVFGEADAGSFARFQAKFDLIAAASVIGLAVHEEEHRAAALAELRQSARVVLDDQRRHGVGYAEQRFFFGHRTPAEFVDEGLRAILEVYAEHHARGGRPIARLAASLPRSNPWHHWEVVQRLALSDLGVALTGVDFCFIEEGHPPKEQRALFSAVRDHNARNPERALSILYHVGESFEDKSLESAVRWVHEAAELGAHRLGHAIALGVDPAAYGEVRRESVAERRDQVLYDLRHAEGLERHGVRVDRPALARELDELDALDRLDALGRRAPPDEVQVVYDDRRRAEVHARQRFAMAAVRAHGAVVEVCPTSNLRIGGLRDPSHHPLRRFLEEQVPVVIASDDPGIFGTTLRDELAWAAAHAGLSAEEHDALAAGAWRYRSERLTGRDR
ncbi:MAG: hypothetical protein HYV09_39680 [Deltaproteobacteria bacterium]|nr:hypothetical protein [Deltaproteobacteria bacterium]